MFGAVQRAVLSLVLVSSASSFAQDALLFVAHGVPGQAVDVYVDGALTLANFQPNEIAGPLGLPAATYQVAVVAQGGSIMTPIVAGPLTLAAGENVTAVAHLDASGNPAITPFVNDMTPASGRGQGRVVVRHTAEAPAVDVTINELRRGRARELAALTGVTSGQGGGLDAPAGRVEVTLAASTGGTVVAGPANFIVEEGKQLSIFAVGTLGSTFTIFTQQQAIGTQSELTAVHGVPGLVVDIYVDGTLTLEDFMPSTVQSLPIAPGSYDIVLVAANADPMTPLLQDTVFLRPGERRSLVAHLDGAGMATFSQFQNRTDLAKAGATGLVLRHCAQAPDVDAVLFRGGGRLTHLGRAQGLPNGAEATLVLPAGKLVVEIVANGDSQPVTDAIEAKLRRRSVTVAYVIGTVGMPDFQILVQQL